MSRHFELSLGSSLWLRCCWGLVFVTVIHLNMSQAIEHDVSPEDVQRFFDQRNKTVITFTGFSGSEYQDRDAMLAHARDVLVKHKSDQTIVNIGATGDGIGQVYALAKRLGFETTGIVSTCVKKYNIEISPHVDRVFFVRDKWWGGYIEDGRTLSPTSTAMVGCSDLMIGIGGGTVARDELLEAKRLGKKVTFFAADMNHEIAIQQAREKGLEPPTDFRGEAFDAMNLTPRTRE